MSTTDELQDLSKSTILKILDRANFPMVAILAFVSFICNLLIKSSDSEQKIYINYLNTTQEYDNSSDSFDITKMNTDQKFALNISIAVIYVIMSALIKVQQELQHRLNKQYKNQNVYLKGETIAMKDTISNISRPVSIQAEFQNPVTLSAIPTPTELPTFSQQHELHTAIPVESPNNSEHTQYAVPYTFRPNNEPIV